MFWTRLISGIILLVIAITAMSVGSYLLMGILLVISLIAYRELTKALLVSKKEKGFELLEWVGFAGVCCYYLTLFLNGSDTSRLICMVSVVMAQMFIYVVTFPKYDATAVVGSVFAFLYAPVMLSFIALVRGTEHGLYMVWLILISAWGSDTCAYAVGMLIGKKKIFPILSPKKSLEGCIGGVLGAGILGGVYAELVIDQIITDQRVVPIIAFICMVGAVMSMVGDLAASAIKRNNGIKDYGKLIPGHGGIMDRFDSVIVTAPMVYFLAIVMLHL